MSSIARGQPGSCLGLVCAAVLVGRAAGLRAHAAAVPDHLLLLLGEDGECFYELLEGAKLYSALDARLHYRIPDGCRTFLRPLTDAELLACVRIERAAEHLEAGRLRRAARDLRIATHDFSDHPAGHYNLGLLQARREQWLASEMSFSTAIARFGLDARYWHNRALVRWRLGRADQAGSDLDEALRLNPEMSEALRLRAVLPQERR